MRRVIVLLTILFFTACSVAKNNCCVSAVRKDYSIREFVANELKVHNLNPVYIGIPKVESNFNPRATYEDCAGLWQLRKSIAKQLGLKVTKEEDERFDVSKSTAAAIKYLKILESKFSDTDLVLAAYNWGEGRVTRALKNKKVFPAKVRAYIAKVRKFAEELS